MSKNEVDLAEIVRRVAREDITRLCPGDEAENLREGVEGRTVSMVRTFINSLVPHLIGMHREGQGFEDRIRNKGIPGVRITGET